MMVIMDSIPLLIFPSFFFTFSSKSDTSRASMSLSQLS